MEILRSRNSSFRRRGVNPSEEGTQTSHSTSEFQLPPTSADALLESTKYGLGNPITPRSYIHGLMSPMHEVAYEIKGAVLATGFAAGCYLLFWFKVVLQPFFLAIFLMYLVDPLVELIDVSPKYFLCICTSRWRHVRRKSRGCSRAFASLVAVLLLCVFFALIGYVTVLSFNALDIEKYQEGYNQFIQEIEHFSAELGFHLNIRTTLRSNLDKVIKWVLTDIFEVASTLFITLIYLIYFLSTRVRPSDAGGIWAKIDKDIQRFVTLKAYLSLLVAILVTIVYVGLNVGLAVVWGILTFVLNWIPNIGALMASFFPLAIIIITPDSLMSKMEKFLAIILPGCFHFVLGNFIEPKVFGKRLEMDPVAVVLSLSFWGLLWGIVGMMLSVPFTAASKIMLSHLKLWPTIVTLLEGTYFRSRTQLQRKEEVILHENVEYEAVNNTTPNGKEDTDNTRSLDLEFGSLSTADEALEQ